MSRSEIAVPTGMRLEDAPSAVVQDETEEEVFNPRKDAMDSIFAKRNKMLEQELALGAEYRATEQNGDPIVIGEASPEVVEEKAPDAVSADPVKPAQAQTSGTAPRKVPLVINGAPLEIDEAELIRLAQRGVGADQQLAQAHALRQEATNIAYNATNAPQPEAAPAAPNKELLAGLVKKLNYGTEDEQASALEELVNVAASARKPQNEATPAQLVDAASRQVMAHIEHRNTLSTVLNEFKGVFADGELSEFAGMQAGKLRQKYAREGVRKTDIDIYREALSKTSEKFGIKNDELSTPVETKSVQATASASNPMEAKIARKRAAPQTITAANTASAAASAQKAPSASDVVAQMRKARHQTPMN
jgi:hypothetical protein